MLKHFFNCIVPVYSCNFRCRYCFVHQTHEEEGKKDYHLDPEKIKNALRIERVGKSFMNLCATGETLIQPEIIEIAKGLLEEGHIVAIVTNATLTRKLQQLCEFPSALRSRLFIKASFHYEQLVEKNLLATYFSNIKMLHEKGISYSMELVASDDLEEHIDDILRIFKEHGEEPPQVIESRETVSGEIGRLTEKNLERHLDLWNKFDSDMFNGMQPFWGEKRKEFCYAGEYSAAIHLLGGEVSQCDKGYGIQNIYKNMEEKLLFCAIGENCQISHCYISYVWQRLCGNVKTLKHEPYYLTRNRRYADGTEWLSDEIKEAWSHVIGEKNGYYSGHKETIVGAFMDAYYKGAENVSEKGFDDALKWIRAKLKLLSAKRVAVYGRGNIGKFIINLLENLDEVNVDAVIDKVYLSLKEPDVHEYLCLSPEKLNEGFLTENGVDTVIVTPFADGKDIQNYIKEIYGKTISTMNILYELNQEK